MTMNFFGLVLTLIAPGMVFLLPRRVALLGVFAGVCYNSQIQQLLVGGFHFTAIRIVLLVGFVRTIMRGEFRDIKINRLDWVFLAFAIYTPFIPGLRNNVWQEPIGTIYNTLLSYFVFRAMIVDWEDLVALTSGLAIFIIPFALIMFYESLSGYNLFSLLNNGAGEWSRGGRYRCMGSFRGPHTVGIFGATLMPLFVGLYFTDPRRRSLGIAGFLAAFTITYTANSSGPLLAYLSCLVGLGFWRMRTDMKLVRWGIVAGLAILALTMKAPIWYIFAKIADIVGGDGWYRSYLMEQCFNHISTWWLMGTDNTAEWGATLMEWGGADLCNIYVSCAAGSGLGSLVLLIVLLVVCFKYLGRALKAVRNHSSEAEFFLWCLGTILFAHMVALFSVTYWDQMHVLWWGLFAIISSVTSAIQNQVEAGEPIGSLVPVDDDIAMQEPTTAP